MYIGIYQSGKNLKRRNKFFHLGKQHSACVLLVHVNILVAKLKPPSLSL